MLLKPLSLLLSTAPTFSCNLPQIARRLLKSVLCLSGIRRCHWWKNCFAGTPDEHEQDPSKGTNEIINIRRFSQIIKRRWVIFGSIQCFLEFSNILLTIICCVGAGLTPSSLPRLYIQLTFVYLLYIDAAPQLVI